MKQIISTIFLIPAICFSQSIKVQIQFADTVEVFYQDDLVYATVLDQNNRHIFKTYQYCLFDVVYRDSVYTLEIAPDSEYNALIRFIWHPSDYAIVPDDNIGYLQLRNRQRKFSSWR